MVSANLTAFCTINITWVNAAHGNATNKHSTASSLSFQDIRLLLKKYLWGCLEGDENTFTGLQKIFNI